MSVYLVPNQMLPAPELIATMDTTSKLIGTLAYAAVKIIFDNQSSVSVVLYISLNGTDKIQWHTFPAGEALILDDDANTFPVGTQFYGVGASGNFSISYTYIKL